MTVQTQTTLCSDIPTPRAKDTTEGDAHIHDATDTELIGTWMPLCFTPRMHLIGCRQVSEHLGMPGTSRPGHLMKWGCLHGFIIAGFTQPNRGRKISFKASPHG